MSNLNTNILYNIVLTISTYVVNLIVFPYVSRVLGVECIGKIGFVDNVIAYFSLFSSLGIVTVGVREIAACGDDAKKRSEVFSSLFILLLYSSIIVTAIFLLTIYFIPKFAENRTLFIIGAFQLFMSSLLLEWLYQGIENFKYITMRNVLVKLLYAMLVFLLIRGKDDYEIYYILTVSVVVVNAIINVFQSRHYVKYEYRIGAWKMFVKPMVYVGTYRVLVSMYTTLNVIYLGFVSSEVEVGYYYTSIKLFAIFLGLISAFTTVIMPRMSSLLSEGKNELFRTNVNHSFDIVFAISFPVIIYCVILAPEIVNLMSGQGYEGAITPMRIVILNVLFVGVAQIGVIQVMMPMKKDKVVLYGSIFGAVVGVVSNILFVENLGAIGSAIVLILSEVAGDSYVFYYILHNNIIKFPIKKLWFNLVIAIPYGIFCFFAQNSFSFNLIVLVVAGGACILYFFFVHKYVFPKSYVGSSVNNLRIFKK